MVGGLFLSVVIKMIDKKKLAEELKSKIKSPGKCNREYIKAMSEEVEHVYKGGLPYPEKASVVKRDVLAIEGQVMYLYTPNWIRSHR